MKYSFNILFVKMFNFIRLRYFRLFLFSEMNGIQFLTNYPSFTISLLTICFVTHFLPNMALAHMSKNSIPQVQRQKSLGGDGQDRASSIELTQDGGFVVARESDSLNGDVTENHGKTDFWVAKLAKDGTLEWQKSLGGSDYDKARSIRQTTDGGYVVAGDCVPGIVDAAGAHGGYDYLVVKLMADASWSGQKPLAVAQTTGPGPSSSPMMEGISWSGGASQTMAK
jgi:hypothetical protein